MPRQLPPLLLLAGLLILAGCGSAPAQTPTASTPGRQSTPSPLASSLSPTPGPPPKESAFWHGLHMIDATTGWILAERQAWRTTDGGHHGVDVTPRSPGVASDDYLTANFLSASLAWIAISHSDGWPAMLLKTIDGGQTWQVNRLQVNRLIGQMLFINPQDGWVSGNGGVAAGSEALDLFRAGYSLAIACHEVVGEQGGHLFCKMVQGEGASKSRI